MEEIIIDELRLLLNLLGDCLSRPIHFNKKRFDLTKKSIFEEADHKTCKKM